MNIDKITLLIQYSNWKEKIRKKEDKKIPDHLPRHITHILDSRNKYYNESLHIRNYVLKSLCALCCSCKCRRASTDTVEVWICYIYMVSFIPISNLLYILSSTGLVYTVGWTFFQVYSLTPLIPEICKTVQPVMRIRTSTHWISISVYAQRRSVYLCNNIATQLSLKFGISAVMRNVNA